MYKTLKNLCILVFLVLITLPTNTQMMPGAPLKPQDIDAILNSMTEDDFNNILNELSKLSPQELEELEKIGRQVLIESGIDPDTGRPLEIKPSTTEPSTGPQELPTKKAPEMPMAAPKIHNPEQVNAILDTIIKNINQLRQKAHGNEVIARRLAQWDEVLHDLVFYSKVINKKEHHNRLATKEFETLFKHLDELSRHLAYNQSHIVLPESTPSQDDPYLMLKLPYTATDEEITQRYEVLKNEYNTKKIRKKLKDQKASQKEIDREVRAAQLTFSLLQDAYDQLHDPKTKKIIDEKRTQQKSDQLSAVSSHALSQLLEAMSTSVYQQKVLEELQEFLKKFEPEQLVHKQTLEAAQEQRKKEQQELSKTRVSPQMTKYDKQYSQHAPRSAFEDPFGRSFGGFPQAGGAITAQTPQAASKQQLPEMPKPEKGSGGGGAGKKPSESKPEEKKEKEPEDKVKKLMEEAAKKDEKNKAEAQKKELAELKEQVKKFKEEAAAPKDKGGQNTPSTTRSKTRSTQERSPHVAALEKDFKKLKSELRNPEIAPLLGRTAKPLAAPLTAEEIQKIETLSLQPLEEHLRLAEKAISPDEWQDITQDYTDLVRRLKKNIDDEVVKQKETVLPELANVQRSINQLVSRYNALSQNLLGYAPLKEKLPSEEPEESFGLPQLFNTAE